MARHLSSVLIAVCLAAAGDPQASGYPTPVDFDGSLTRWNLTSESDPITYEVKSDDDALVQTYGPTVEEAAELWSATSNSYFRFAPVEAGAQAQVTVNLKSSIDGGDVSAGYAVFDLYDGTNPAHCSTYILTDQTMSELSIAKTILHELGHCVGLGHSMIPQAIMSYSLNENRFALDVDDMAAVARLYPADGSTPELPPGCGAGPHHQRSAGAIMLATLLIPLLATVSRLPASGRWIFWL